MKSRLLLSVVAGLLLIQVAIAERFIPKSDLIPYVLTIIDKGYVDHSRILPDKMLDGALSRLSLSIAPVMTEYKDLGGKFSLKLSVDQKVKTLETFKPKDVQELSSVLQTIALFTKQNMENTEKLENVDFALINGALKKLDPHTALMIPEIYESFSEESEGSFSGVGMTIGIRDGKLTVISPIPGTPAARAGLRARDQIVQVDSESTVNVSITDAVKKIKGKRGTVVVLHIMRKGFSAPKKYSLKRDTIKINSVESHVFKEKDKKVGYVQLKGFQRTTIDELDDHLDEMEYDLSEFKGLIIDLRNNPGGHLDQAIRVSDRFLDRGIIVSTAGLSMKNISSHTANWLGSIDDIPIIVLVNNGSASASEIVTAALKKNQRALVIGNTTFGKGSVQAIREFSNGSALKYTTSKYLTPGNISIQSVGVAPHINLQPYFVTQEHVRITPEKRDNLEDSLDQNFSEWGDKPESADQTLAYVFEESDEEYDEYLEPHQQLVNILNKDFWVQFSKKILLNNNEENFESLYQTALKTVKSETKIQEQKLVKAFSKFENPVNWETSEGKTTSSIESKIWIEKNKGTVEKPVWEKVNGDIAAKSSLRIFAQVKNVGKTDVFRLFGETMSENNIFNDRQFAFGKLSPGELRSWYLPIGLSEAGNSRSNLIEFEFKDHLKEIVHRDQLVLNVLEKPKPNFSYSISLLEDGTESSKGNGDQKLQTGETISVIINLKNIGRGKSGPITVLLKSAEGKNIFLKKGRVTLDAIKSGASSKADFQFDVNAKPIDEIFDFSVDIIDQTFTSSSINQKIKVAVDSLRNQLSNETPTITIKGDYLTSKTKNINLKGMVDDDQQVKDLYVFSNKKKIFYKNYLKKQANKIKFSIPVMLNKQDNFVTIISRDNEDVITRKSIFIRYLESK